MPLSNTEVKAAVPVTIQWLKDQQPSDNLDSDPTDYLHAAIHELAIAHLQHIYTCRYSIPLENTYAAYDGSITIAFQRMIEANKRIEAERNETI